MVFMSRWRRLKALEEEKKKIQKRSGAAEEFVTGRQENLKLCLSVLTLIMISAVVVIGTSQTLKVALFPLKSRTGLQPTRNRPLHVSKEGTAEHSWYETQFQKIPVIKDVVIMPEEILLLVAVPVGSSFASKEGLTCIFGARSSTKVIGIEYKLRRAAVRCEVPQEGLDELYRGVALDQVNGAESVLVEMSNLPNKFMTWNRLVFEILLTPADVVLFAKGVAKKQGQNLTTKDLRCMFDDLVETHVITAAQEVFRCQHPPSSMRQQLIGKKVTLKVNGTTLPSVAYYEFDAVSVDKELEGEDSNIDLRRSQMPEKKHLLCACTMIFNGAKFLKEWIVYHTHLGVERFFLYDNNSEDKLKDAVQMLSSYNVTRHPWPWVKTQEAGFSYCAQKAQQQCTWMMFTDVDEFLFPQSWISPLSHDLRTTTKDVGAAATKLPILTTLISDTVREQTSSRNKSLRRKVGQISFNCVDFGPSGLKEHPKEGVMQGYTCRVVKKQRHKSIVYLQAISKSLLNVVHHFSLQSSYRTILLPAEKAVINHYKYQAWEEFKAKFRRRVSAFVSDWKESKNLLSKDRTPGLGSQDIKPPNWEHMFCEVNDTALRDYARDTFGPVISWQ
ncbi:hypothetical protein O6H91_14G034500 [Diphasiastrum complanatum]|uniref:Uncharacterized protein n=6 Tax=Diphasiastrum complanatum TaxID=34168 RepID=A0ACC2BNR8_DIPCM|nr:hypothetical protein O6H91_14G034500 [Diphasiastrum complanatum]KAJ7531158.1 hypothetical protein O6H91_14G034500 [Diphasiastrum complanatum]KAJ7531159.1 hypothetical protein O6H91_14G034500 [Diphasiastrum complanatum]KAJ7531160.1 hypothetical protein O6H91_14G034500 [Diphasiastrum complanatum]KAJ7531161.1 hypothetical protein O6H91_14G034500 [Diphasiastrum complanatum]